MDVTSETEYNQNLKEVYNSLLSLEGVGEATATNLYQDGFRSVVDVANATVGDLVQIRGISEEKAEKIIESAKGFLKSGNAEEIPAEEHEQIMDAVNGEG